jgi:hypothetical protein
VTKLRRIKWVEQWHTCGDGKYFEVFIGKPESTGHEWEDNNKMNFK